MNFKDPVVTAMVDAVDAPKIVEKGSEDQMIESPNAYTFRSLLAEWIDDGRFMTANTEDSLDLIKRSKKALGRNV